MVSNISLLCLTTAKRIGNNNYNIMWRISYRISLKWQRVKWEWNFDWQPKIIAHFTKWKHYPETQFSVEVSFCCCFCRSSSLRITADVDYRYSYDRIIWNGVKCHWIQIQTIHGTNESRHLLPGGRDIAFYLFFVTSLKVSC